MMQGKECLVTIRFVNHLIDTVVDRLGTEGVQYAQIDENHFTVTAKLEVGSMFYGWLLGFGKGAKLLAPNNVRDQFVSYIDQIKGVY